MNDKICLKCKITFKKPYFRSLKEWGTTKYCSHSCANSVNKNGKLFKKGQISWNKGRKGLTGEKNPQWSRIKKNCLECNKEFVVKNYRKNIAKFCSPKCSEINRNQGKTTLNQKIRKSKEYKLWRNAVFERDDYTCQSCWTQGEELQVDHIKPFALYPELRFAIDNGRTLCVGCHRQTGTWGYSQIYRTASVEES